MTQRFRTVVAFANNPGFAWYACQTAGETFIHSYQNFKMKSSLFRIIPTYIFIDHLVFISSKNNAFFTFVKLLGKIWVSESCFRIKYIKLKFKYNNNIYISCVVTYTICIIIYNILLLAIIIFIFLSSWGKFQVTGIVSEFEDRMPFMCVIFGNSLCGQ